MVLAACGADRKAAADGMRAIIDESGGAVGWRVTGSASWSLPLCRVVGQDSSYGISSKKLGSGL
jgi:hypothetical protein